MSYHSLHSYHICTTLDELKLSPVHRCMTAGCWRFVSAALKELNRYYQHCLSVCKQLRQNGDSMLDSVDSVIQSAPVTADKLLYSYAVELVCLCHELSLITLMLDFNPLAPTVAVWVQV